MNDNESTASAIILPPMKRKRSKPFNALAASRKLLESQGWAVSVVESRIPHTFITRDCYGFADLLACKPSEGIMLVQVTGGTGRSNALARIRKIQAEPMAGIWLASGGKIVVHSWQVVKGTKKRQVVGTEIYKDLKTKWVLFGHQ